MTVDYIVGNFGTQKFNKAIAELLGGETWAGNQNV